MKTYPKHTRSYILVGELVAEYKGKSASSIVKDVIEFDIKVYKAAIHHARVVDASFLDCIVENQSAQALSIDCPTTVLPRNSSEQFTVSPREATVYRTSLEGVSEIGSEVYGTLRALVVFPVEEKTFRLNPISIPAASINGTFLGYADRPKVGADAEETAITPNISIRPIVEGAFQLLGWLIMFLLALTLFSIIPPRLLLLLCGIAAVAILIEILPKSLSAKIVATLKSIGVVLFYLLGGLFVLWLGFIFIRNLLPFFLFWLPLVGLAIAISYLYGNLKTIGRVASTIGLSILALAIPILWGLSTSSSSSPTETTYNPVPNRATNSPVVTPIEVVKPQVPSDTSAITQTLAWDDFSGKRYQITFNLKRSDIRASKDKREQLQVPINANRDFGMLFNKILHRENDQLSSFINQLDSIRTTNELMPVAFAETVVSLVQQLEYSLLFEQSCPTTTRLPCKQGVKYGVYTPTEFLYFLRGDCDTKALLLYLIFKEFNYDVAIMGSIFYQHAMLALDLPSERGAALLYENDAFYVWEVTAPGWRLGELPPQSDQLQFWDIILAHNKD